MNQISLTIDSRPENVPLAGLCAKEFAGNVFNTEQLSNIEQALVETVNNCIEHAYSDVSSEGVIEITYSLSDDCIVIEVMDQGKQFDPAKLENLDKVDDFDPLDFDNLPEGGFGLKVIKSCMDKIDYRRDNGRNHWLLTKYRNAAGI